MGTLINKHVAELRILGRTLVLGVLLSCPGLVQAVPFQLGDVMASTANGQVEQWRPGSGLVGTYSTGASGYVTGSAFDASGNLLVTNFSSGTVYNLAGPGDPHTATLFASQGNSPEGVVFDKSGNVYVSSSNNGDIIKYNSAGTVLDSWNTGSSGAPISRADFIDLAADDNHIYFTLDIQKGVYILDLTTSTVSSFSTTYGNYALRLLADGSVLVANSSDIVLLDNTGAFVRSYDVANVGSWFALNLDPNGTSFWSASFGTGLIQEFNIATGALETSFASGNNGGPWGLSVFGEITQGGPGPGPGPSPIPEPGSLALLGLGLSGLIITRRRRKTT